VGGLLGDVQVQLCPISKIKTNIRRRSEIYAIQAPQHLFDDSVIRAVSQWRYEKNKPAKDMHITVKFKINSYY